MELVDEQLKQWGYSTIMMYQSKVLLIFPGDWQPVLLKIYYHAGLKEIAQNSGFRVRKMW